MNSTETPSRADIGSSDLFSAVRPKGWLGERLKNISNPRKRRWKSYVRACRKIPKTSPVHGTTSWKKINDRRHELIVKEIAEHKKTGKPWTEMEHSKELAALQKVCGELCCGPTVASNFLMARLLRRLRAENNELRDGASRSL